MGEVAAMFGVNASLIRFYEKEFDIIKPHRNKKGNRLFTKQDVDNFQLIFELVKDKGFTLDGAKQKIRELNKKPASEAEILQTLYGIKRFLLEMRSQL